MEFNFTSQVALEGVINFPDYSFADLPRQNPIDEQANIQGNSTGTTISIGGSVGNMVV
jgi:hypothetical protein